MADLPNLDTDAIGFIAFWNALDHGVSDIDPTEVLDYAAIITFEQFDNGVEGTLAANMAAKSRIYNWRVKDDGWFIVWVDRTNQFATLQSSAGDIDGYYDIVDWAAPNSLPPELPQTVLSQEIDELRQRLSNSGDITFAHADVGYFNFEFDTAERFALASTVENAPTTIRPAIAYVAGTTRFYHAATGAMDMGPDNFPTSTVDFPAGDTLVSVSNFQEREWGTADVIADGTMPNAGEFVDGRINNGDASVGHLTHLTVFTP